MKFANEKKKHMGRNDGTCSSSLFLSHTHIHTHTHTHFSLHIEVSKNYRQNEKTWFISVANKLPGQYHIRMVLQGIIEPYTGF